MLRLNSKARHPRDDGLSSCKDDFSTRGQIGLRSITGILNLDESPFTTQFFADTCHCDAALFCYASQIERGQSLIKRPTELVSMVNGLLQYRNHDFKRITA
ncbi:MAG: hypothetical protein NT013_26460 [Planctomycetia bacterium]|nr:hypothetical protein [Planctomycetia bacterium]